MTTHAQPHLNTGPGSTGGAIHAAASPRFQTGAMDDGGKAKLFIAARERFPVIGTEPSGDRYAAPWRLSLESGGGALLAPHGNANDALIAWLNRWVEETSGERDPNLEEQMKELERNRLSLGAP